MAWIQSDQTLRDHPKVKRAARLLEIPRPQMLGHLHLLWWWAVDYAPDGDLTDYDPDEIADAAMWDGDPEAFVGALIDCGRSGPGLLDAAGGVLAIHDWDDHAGRAPAAQRRVSDGGALGNHRRWHVARGITDPDCPHCDTGNELSTDESGGSSPPIRPRFAPDSGGDSPPNRPANRRGEERRGETPPRARAREGSPTEPVDNCGGESSQHPNPTDRTIHKLTGTMPPPLAEKTHRQRDAITPHLTPLLTAGWTPTELTDAITQSGWHQIRDPAAIIRKRAQALTDTTPPRILQQRRERAEQQRREHAEQQDADERARRQQLDAHLDALDQADRDELAQQAHAQLAEPIRRTRQPTLADPAVRAIARTLIATTHAA